MPTYVYKIKDKPQDDPSAFFEVRQSMTESALTAHPETGEAVERVICAPMIGGRSAAPADATSTVKSGHHHGPGCGCH